MECTFKGGGSKIAAKFYRLVDNYYGCELCVACL